MTTFHPPMILSHTWTSVGLTILSSWRTINQYERSLNVIDPTKYMYYKKTAVSDLQNETIKTPVHLIKGEFRWEIKSNQSSEIMSKQTILGIRSTERGFGCKWFSAVERDEQQNFLSQNELTWCLQYPELVSFSTVQVIFVNTHSLTSILQ